MKFSILSLFASLVLFLSACQQNPLNPSKPTHEEVMKQSFPKPKKEVKTVGILLYDGYTTLDAMGPHQVLSEMMGTRVFFVAREKGLVKNMGGMEVKVDHSFAEVDSLDILVIPGGLKETYLLRQDTALLNWVKKIDRTTTYTASVCTGAWVLAATGLLQGKNATTHWYGKKILREMGVNVLDQRWVQDGKYWTSAGVTAGMDMCFAIINDVMGEKYTKTAMLDLEYDPQPLFQAGSEQNTEKEIVDLMRQMYDAGLDDVKNSPKTASKAAPTSKAAPSSPTATLPWATHIDLVCDMTVEENTPDTVHYHGKVYGFCSAYCKEKFQENPTRWGAK